MGVNRATLDSLDAHYLAEIEALAPAARAEAILRMRLWKRAERIHQKHPRFSCDEVVDVVTGTNAGRRSHVRQDEVSHFGRLCWKVVVFEGI